MKQDMLLQSGQVVFSTTCVKGERTRENVSPASSFFIYIFSFDHSQRLLGVYKMANLQQHLFIRTPASEGEPILSLSSSAGADFLLC